eukprot:SAG11_NODE_11936_length_730_cov_2.427892_1_plen_89_part_00
MSAAPTEDYGIPNEIRDRVPAEVRDTPDNIPAGQYRAVFGDDGRFQHHVLIRETDAAAHESWNGFPFVNYILMEDKLHNHTCSTDQTI